MIAYIIREPRVKPLETIRLGFSVWANSPPKDYLSTYPIAANTVAGTKQGSLCAIIDDIWPRITLSRTPAQQAVVTNCYKEFLPKIGFRGAHAVSEFVDEIALEECLLMGARITVAEFWKLLPQSKKGSSCKLSLTEVIGFLWHIHVVKIAMNKYELTGMLAGIRSEFFYLAARKLLPPHDLYFVNTS